MDVEPLVSAAPHIPSYSEVFGNDSAVNREEAMTRYIQDNRDKPVGFTKAVWRLLSSIELRSTSPRHHLQMLNAIPYSALWLRVIREGGLVSTDSSRTPNRGLGLQYLLDMQNAYFSSAPKGFTIDPAFPAPSYQPETRGRIRYFAGSHLYRNILQLQNMQKKYSYSDLDRARLVPEKLRLAKKLMAKKETLLAHSTDPMSLNDIEVREQTQLTYITDEAAAFYYRLHNHLEAFFNLKAVAVNSIASAKESLHSQASIYDAWRSLFPTNSNEEYVTDLFNSMMDKYINTMGREARQRAKRSWIRKTMAHRKQIGQRVQEVTYQSVIDSLDQPPEIEPEAEWLCPICLMAVGDDDCIECTECYEWIHVSCGELDDAEFVRLTESEEEEAWACPMCTPMGE